MVNIHAITTVPMLAELAWHRGTTAPEWDNVGINQQGSVIILLDKLTENDIKIDR